MAARNCSHICLLVQTPCCPCWLHFSSTRQRTMYFGRNFGWFSLSLSQSSWFIVPQFCSTYILFCLCFFWRNVLFSNKLVLILVLGFPSFFCRSLFLQVWRETDLKKESSWRAKTFRPHTYKQPLRAHSWISHPLTLHSHPTTPYLLIPSPTSRTLHPTTLHSYLPPTPSTRRARNFRSIVLPKYSSQRNFHTA